MGVSNDGRLALALALRGEDEGPALASVPPESREAWRLATEAARWHLDPEAHPMPSLEAIARAAGETVDARRASCAACVQIERAHLLGFDSAGHARCLELHRRLAGGAGEPWIEAWLEIAERWALLADGSWLADDDTRALAAVAREADDASLAIEAVAQRAIGRSLGGDLETALASARQASRMSRTEGLWQSEYLAHLVLARLRRWTGRPHLSARIVEALGRVAPPAWRASLRWEATLSCAPLALGEPTASPASIAVDALDAVLSAAEAGDAEELERSSDALRLAVEGFAPAAQEAETVLALIDPNAGAKGDEEQFRRGVTHEPPAAARGLVPADDLGDAAVLAWVVARPGSPACRILDAGKNLARDARRLDPPKGGPGRPEATASALLLARGPVDTASLFRTVYGFAYQPELHRGVFDVLLHRVRKRLDGVAEIAREADAVSIVVNAPFLVPDPRCGQPLEELMLRYFVRHRGASAKQAAESLALPLRTAQRALAQLVEEGAVERQQVGRQVVYHVEDTTFEEPSFAARSRISVTTGAS